MMGKRPLVWLSATSSNTDVRKEFEAHWNLIDFNFDKPAPLLAAIPDETRVGVLELPEFSAEDTSHPESWLETLDLKYWVAIAPFWPAFGTRTARLITHYCSDFHTVPVESGRMNTVLGHLWGMATILEPAKDLSHDRYQALALQGDSHCIQQVRSLLRRFSATLEPVLITGESSTGKEAAARFIHSHSSRACGPLVTINCAALPATLIQSELFGYEKGAFTHALSSRQGRLEQADGGTLVLSGIDELRLEQQSVILRFLQEGFIERVGGSTPISIDCRLITTTSQPLPDLIALGHFRRDVYYRLGGLEVKLPALKNRLEDIPILAKSLLEAASSGATKKRLSNKAVESLVSHPWPGNFRELQNCLQQGWLLSDRPVIEASDLGLTHSGSGSQVPAPNFSLKEFRAKADRQALLCSLRLANNNMSEAARLLNISRVSLYRLMNKYNPSEQNLSSRHRPVSKGDLP
ncbi:MAG: sigma-54 dependent transcriptional regulator [Marinobacter sp.]|nr:sigma-54 dependent transcriptional regulator [Marinobacter sp.]